MLTFPIGDGHWNYPICYCWMVLAVFKQYQILSGITKGGYFQKALYGGQCICHMFLTADLF
ncbi:unnamed protein product [Trifolium pratense]|uniref:Uncharacterized protein n=1 Tax=Trifolium pratense TaxID=57577 RepID=A0ACB0MCE5_TRIPR|nr:unnamed protein product [Trifolium pratense]